MRDKKEVIRVSPRTGRPKSDNPKDIRFSVRMDAEMFNELKRMCERESITVAEAIRLAVKQLLERK